MIAASARAEQDDAHGTESVDDGVDQLGDDLLGRWPGPPHGRWRAAGNQAKRVIQVHRYPSYATGSRCYP